MSVPSDETMPLGAGGEHAPPPLGAMVRVLRGGTGPLSYRLQAGSCTLGTAPDCDIVVDDPTVSRMHAMLELVPEGVRVRDLGSRNGTFYLGSRITEATVGLGARLQLGATELWVDVDREAIDSATDWTDEPYRGVVGRSSAMRRVFGVLARLEGSLTTVLIEGESGVGKEVVARAIHEGSPVGGGPLVAVNCGALPRDLAASELFGHRRGAFTGASESRRGAFESASGGTLFLDEIGELPLEIQPLLLRTLESGDVKPVGGDDVRHVRVRVIAATNRKLEEQVRDGQFREDLFYRLAVIRIQVPPLRTRPDDIEPLAQAFARDVGIEALPPTVIEQLRGRAWPGNARELRNAVHAYAVLGVVPDAPRKLGDLLELAFEELIDVRTPYNEQKEAIIDRFTRQYVRALLAHTNGNQTLAARIAGLDRTYLGRLLAKLSVKKR